MVSYDNVTQMKFFTKKSKAVKKWHSRAMIIDLSKTRVTFLSREDLNEGASQQVDGEIDYS
jgi:hypothetical protein